MKNSNVSDVSSFQSSLNNLHLIINTIQILSMKEYTTMPWKGTFPKFFPTTIFPLPPKKFPQLVNKQGEKEFRSKPNPPRSRPPPPILSSNRNEKKETKKDRKKERRKERLSIQASSRRSGFTGSHVHVPCGVASWQGTRRTVSNRA